MDKIWIPSKYIEDFLIDYRKTNEIKIAYKKDMFISIPVTKARSYYATSMQINLGIKPLKYMDEKDLIVIHKLALDSLNISTKDYDDLIDINYTKPIFDENTKTLDKRRIYVSVLRILDDNKIQILVNQKPFSKKLDESCYEIKDVSYISYINSRETKITLKNQKICNKDQYNNEAFRYCYWKDIGTAINDN